MADWIFQGNPDRFAIDEYLNGASSVYWRVVRHQTDIQLGDRVFMWRASGSTGGVAGVVAVGTVDEPPTSKRNVAHPERLSDELWRGEVTDSDELKAGISLTEVRLTPDAGMLTRAKLRDHPILSDLPILSFAQGTNYPITPAQAEALIGLWHARAASDAGLARHFTVGQPYTRADLYRLIDVPEDAQGGDWDTGYHQHGETFFVFCNVDVAGRTGHDYDNEFDGDELIWFAKNGTRLAHPQIQKLLAPGREVLIFFRLRDRDPFTFQGVGTPADVTEGADDLPVKVRWVFQASEESHSERSAEELPPAIAYPEGAVKQVTVNRYERNPAARLACIAHHGCQCAVCGFDFEAMYGERGRGFIHVHHLVSLSAIATGYNVNPVTDLIPVCPNCHAMLHQPPNVEVQELRSSLRLTNTAGALPPALSLRIGSKGDRLRFLGPDELSVQPEEWLRFWAGRFPTEKYPGYEELIAKAPQFAASDFEDIGRWKDAARSPNKWRSNVASVAFDIWQQVMAELPTCPVESRIGDFLRGWSERTYEPILGGRKRTKRFGLSRSTALLHFLTGGRMPIFDSRVRRALRRLGMRGIANTVEGYLQVYCPTFSALALHCGAEDLRLLDQALFSYGGKVKSQ